MKSDMPVLIGSTRVSNKMDVWGKGNSRTSRHKVSIDVLHVLTCCTCHSPGLVEGRKEMFYLTTFSTHFIYGYMALDIIW